MDKDTTTEERGPGTDSEEIPVPGKAASSEGGQSPVNGIANKPFARQYSLPAEALETLAEPVETKPAPASPAPAPAEEGKSAQKRGGRLMALDAFRGLTVALMLLVNNAALGTATPESFVHARSGHDPTLADFVFPWFLLAVGIAIPFSAASKIEKGQTFWLRAWGTLRRATSLYLVGLLLDSSIHRAPYFGLGVLQLIALAYLVGRLVYELPLYARICLIGGCLWWYGTALTNTQYSPAGTFTEEQNLVRYLNENLFAPYRLRGVLSVVPTAALVLLGSLVGDALRRDKWVPMARFFFLLGLGANLAILGSVWGYFLPMNKPFWTPSYIVYAGGWGILVVALFFFIADIWGGRYWPLRLFAYPMVVYGTNALVAYAGAILVKVHILQEWQIPAGETKQTLQQAALEWSQRQFGGETGGWFYLIGYLVAVWFVCAFLYHRRLFVRA